MNDSNFPAYPPFIVRVSAVWLRHFKVYSRSLFSNSLPPFLEPLIFLAGIGLGMAGYLPKMAGMPYLTFLATGLPLTAAMFVAASECSYGTFIRLEFDKVYDGMLAAPLSVYDILIGEIAWAATIAMFFSLVVVAVVACFGLVPDAGQPAYGYSGVPHRRDVCGSFASGDLFRAEHQSIQFLFHRFSLSDVFLLRRGVPHRKPSPRPAHCCRNLPAHPCREACPVF